MSINNKTVFALIPARSGSKSIPHKNIQSFNGKPLLAHSIDHAIASTYIDKVILSTDDSYYADLGKAAGAEVPFLRPESISQDNSTDLEVFQHAIDYFESKNEVPDIWVHLRPTSPNRNPEDIDRMIEILASDPSIDSVRSIMEASFTPYKMWFKEENGKLNPVLLHNDIEEAFNAPRQKLPVAYMQTATIDVVNTRTIREQHSMTGNNIAGYELGDISDVDTYSDMEKAVMSSYRDAKPKKYCFDMDGVIARLSPNNDYNLSKPNQPVIDKVNALFDAGNYIKVFTARGSETGIDWYDISKNQLDSWGVKYHEFHTGKPNADFYVDDKNLLISQLLK